MSGRSLFGSRQIGRHINEILSKTDGIYIHILYLIESLQHTAGNHTPHIPGMVVASCHIVKVHEHIVQVSAPGMDIHMVHIALGTVEENAFGIIQCFFNSIPQKTGPVRGDLAASHHIGMVAEVHQHQGVFCTVKAQHIHPFIHITDGVENVGIVHTGVGAYRTVLHAEATDEGDIGSLTDAITHIGGL